MLIHFSRDFCSGRFSGGESDGGGITAQAGYLSQRIRSSHGKGAGPDQELRKRRTQSVGPISPRTPRSATGKVA